MAKQETKKLLWLDLETTGLNPENGEILEIGMIVTDLQLNELDSINLVTKNATLPNLKAMCSNAAFDMHSKNGLFTDLAAVDMDRYYANAVVRLLLFVNSHFQGLWERPALHGSSVHFDKKWMEAHLPGIAALFHHRIVDVSSLKIVFQNYFPEIAKDIEASKSASPTHRTLDDIRESIKEYAAYLKAMQCLVPQTPEDT